MSLDWQCIVPLKLPIVYLWHFRANTIKVSFTRSRLSIIYIFFILTKIPCYYPMNIVIRKRILSSNALITISNIITTKYLEIYQGLVQHYNIHFIQYPTPSKTGKFDWVQNHKPVGLGLLMLGDDLILQIFWKNHFKAV